MEQRASQYTLINVRQVLVLFLIVVMSQRALDNTRDGTSNLTTTQGSGIDHTTSIRNNLRRGWMMNIFNLQASVRVTMFDIRLLGLKRLVVGSSILHLRLVLLHGLMSPISPYLNLVHERVKEDAYLRMASLLTKSQLTTSNLDIVVIETSSELFQRSTVQILTSVEIEVILQAVVAAGGSQKLDGVQSHEGSESKRQQQERIWERRGSW